MTASHLSAMLEQEDLAAVLCNSHGLIIQVNREFERVFGWPAEEIVGQPLTTIIAPALRDAHLAGFARLLKTGKPRLLGQPIRLRAVDKDGREFSAEHLIVGEKRDDDWYFAATMRRVVPR